MIDALSRNKVPVAGVAGMGALVYYWPTIKPVLVSVIGVKAAAAFALLAAAFGVYTFRFAMSRAVEWLKNWSKPVPPKARSRKPISKPDAPSRPLAQKVNDVLGVVEGLRSKIGAQQKSLQSDILAGMLVQLNTAWGLLNNKKNELDRSKRTVDFRNLGQSSFDLLSDAALELTFSLSEILQPVYNSLMDPESHQKLPSSCNRLSADIRDLQTGMPHMLTLANVAVAEGRPPNCILKETSQ